MLFVPRYSPYARRRVVRRGLAGLCLAWLVLGTPCRADTNTLDRLYRRLAGQPRDVELLEMLRQAALSEQNAGPKGDALVLYCLGSLYAGRRKQAERIKSYLATVHPDHPSLGYLSPSKLNEGCKECGGSAKASVDCPACYGSLGGPSPERLRMAYRAMLVQVLGMAEPSKSPSPADTEAAATEADAEPAAVEWESMSGYVAAVKALRERYREGAVATGDFKEIFSHPDRYTGQVFRCTVHLMDYHLRALSVSSSVGAGTGVSGVLTPDTIWIGSKAGRIVKQHGASVAAVVTFGLLTRDQNILFEVDKQEGGSPAGQ